MWPSQMADDRPSQPRETPDFPQPTAALWTAGYGMHERGSNEGWHRQRSYWVARHAPTRCAPWSAPASARWGCWPPGRPAADLGAGDAAWLTG